MNRFFSKLDLRDIKIDPEGSRFPPDADDEVVENDESSPSQASPKTVTIALEQPVVEPTPKWPDSHRSASADLIDEPVAADSLASPSSSGAFHHVRADRIASAGAEGESEVLKVSARSRPSAVAGAIAGVVRESGRAEVQAIGAGATNQAVKAVAIARDYLRETGIDAVCIPAFIDVTINNEDRTAIRLVVEPR
jgi:stage V sporulation protein S